MILCTRRIDCTSRSMGSVTSSSTMLCAARPTAFIVSPQKRNDIIAPMKTPISTVGFISDTR